MEDSIEESELGYNNGVSGTEAADMHGYRVQTCTICNIGVLLYSQAALTAVYSHSALTAVYSQAALTAVYSQTALTAVYSQTALTAVTHRLH